MASTYYDNIEELNQLLEKKHKVSCSYSDKWIYFSKKPLKKNYGLKIHVSMDLIYLNENISKILNFLCRLESSFKIPASLEIAKKLNNGDYGKTQVGKIITVYIDDRISEISEISNHFNLTNGPYIPFEYSTNKCKSVFLRFGAYKINCIYDLFGRPEPIYIDVNGKLKKDNREKKITKRQLPSSIRLYKETVNIERILKGSFLPVKLISDTPKSKIFKGVNISTFEDIVIKVVPNNFAGDLNGVNSNDKLYREYKILQMLAQNKYAFSPRSIFYKKNEQISLIVMKEIKQAVSYQKLDKTKQLLLFPDIIDMVNQLHSQKVIHGDIKPTNILYSKEKLYLIDFETSQTSEHRYKSDYGTVGFFLSDKPYISSFYEIDYVCLISLLFSVYLNQDASLLPYNQKIRLQLLIGLGYKMQAEIIDSIIQNPALIMNKNVVKTLVELSFTKEKISTPERKVINLEGALNLLSSKLDHQTKSWKSTHLYSEFPLAALNIGTAGTLLSSMTLTRNHGRDVPVDYYKAAKEISKFNYGSKSNGLFTGNAGLGLVLGLYGVYFKDQQLLRAATKKINESIKISKEPDFFSGMAGVLYSTVLFKSITQDDESVIKAQVLYRQLIGALKKDSKSYYWNPSGILEKNKRPFVGLAHGTIGIAFAIYKYAKSINDDDGIALSLECLKSVFQVIDSEKNTIKRYHSETSPSSNNFYWCHGLTGYLWVLNQLSVKDMNLFEMEVETIFKMLENSEIPINPTICHGLAGILEAYMPFKNIPKFSHLASEKADQIMYLLNATATKTSQYLHWNSELPTVITPDFMVGYAGTAAVVSQYNKGKFYPIISEENFTSLSK